MILHKLQEKKKGFKKKLFKSCSDGVSVLLHLIRNLLMIIFLPFLHRTLLPNYSTSYKRNNFTTKMLYLHKVKLINHYKTYRDHNLQNRSLQLVFSKFS